MTGDILDITGQNMVLDQGFINNNGIVTKL